jgi:hypothetical protein
MVAHGASHGGAGPQGTLSPDRAAVRLPLCPGLTPRPPSAAPPGLAPEYSGLFLRLAPQATTCRPCRGSYGNRLQRRVGRSTLCARGLQTPRHSTPLPRSASSVITHLCVIQSGDVGEYRDARTPDLVSQGEVPSETAAIRQRVDSPRESPRLLPCLQVLEPSQRRRRRFRSGERSRRFPPSTRNSEPGTRNPHSAAAGSSSVMGGFPSASQPRLA